MDVPTLSNRTNRTINANRLITELLWRRLERFRLHNRSWKFHRHRLLRGQCTLFGNRFARTEYPSFIRSDS